MPRTTLKLYQYKVEGQRLAYDAHNQKLFDIFDEQLPAGIYDVEIKQSRQPKTTEQLGYWYGGVVGGFVQQMLDRGDDVLGHRDFGRKAIPVMVNKANCDDCLKTIYMISIGKPLEAFGKRDASIEEMGKLIDWSLDYLARYRNIYIPSPEEYKLAMAKG